MGLCELIHGDCLEEMKKLESKSIDLVLTDQPYGTTACKWDNVIPFEPMWNELKRVRKDNAAICLFGSEPFSSTLRVSNLKEYKYDWIWQKDKGTNFASCHKQPLRVIETISVFYNKQPKYDSQGEKLDKPYKHTLPLGKSESSPGGGLKTHNEDGSRVYVEYTHSTKKNHLYFARDNGQKGVHPTQKPVALLEYLIKTYTLEGDTVLDFTMGSGSTGVACKNLGRKFIGIEKDDKYFEIAEKRIREHALNAAGVKNE
jgi:DNA modification methylase